ncbi:MAG: lysine 2,3-aminomutase [Gelidibacter sp.]
MSQKTEEVKKYKSFSVRNFRKIPQVENLTEEERTTIETVGQVLPFKVNNYVIDELIDWENYKDDPIFHLTFPQKGMLDLEDFNTMARAIEEHKDRTELKVIADEIRNKLNPHPANQMQMNVPELDGQILPGVQHKYRETALFFPTAGQTCHSYCTFCFRWPQFVGMDGMKFAMKETDLLIDYLSEHPEVTDVLFTGGDPMVMGYKVFREYIDPFLQNRDKTNVKTIRIGTKSLGFWPYKYTTDKDADKFIALFQEITDSGLNLAFMAHFNHPVELTTPVVKEAVRRIRDTGAQIRTQSPLVKHINDCPDVWARMWRKQVDMGMIPYYMFIERDTGARAHFELPLEKTWEIFRDAYQQVSGLCRTVRGPSMSATPGKVQILGVTEIPVHGKMEKVFVLQLLQGRNPDWVAKPFFAKYDPEAYWLDDLEPAFGDKFFYDMELDEMKEEAKMDMAEALA